MALSKGAGKGANPLFVAYGGIMAIASLEYHRDYFYRRKARLIAILGGKCIECGSTENLEFDHIDPTTKIFSITQRIKERDETVLPELAKCQLLCKKHHKAKSDAALSVEHGGGKAGKRNCKCGPCRDKKNAYMREYKRERRLALAA